MTDETPVRCEVIVDAPTPEGLLASAGARIEETRIEGETVVVSVTVPDNGMVAALADALSEEYDATSVSTVWTGRTDRTPSEAELLAMLTDRQREILRQAFDLGYYELPRDVSATELAAYFDIARATLTQHIRTAERKLLSRLFE